MKLKFAKNIFQWNLVKELLFDPFIFKDKYKPPKNLRKTPATNIKCAFVQFCFPSVAYI